MSLATKTSKTFARRVVMPTYSLISARYPFGEAVDTHDFGRRSFQSYPRRNFSTKMDKIDDLDTVDLVAGSIDKKQGNDSNPIEKIKKNIFQRTFKKYSVSEQKNRILVAESLFQAATSQASDP